MGCENVVRFSRRTTHPNITYMEANEEDILSRPPEAPNIFSGVSSECALSSHDLPLHVGERYENRPRSSGNIAASSDPTRFYQELREILGSVP